MILLLDGNSILYRSFHSTKGLDKNTRGVFLFIKRLMYELERWKPRKTYIIFDGKRCEWRKQLYPKYKASRKTDDNEIFKIIQSNRQSILSCFNKKHEKISIAQMNKFEADDGLAYLALKVYEKEEKIVVVSDDYDMSQLCLLRKGCKMAMTDRLLNKKLVYEKYNKGKNNAVADYKSMVGDSSDNIKGVTGVGSKKAELIQKYYGSYRSFYNIRKNKHPQMNKIFSKFRTQQCIDQYELCRKLIDLGYIVKKYKYELSNDFSVIEDAFENDLELNKNIQRLFKKFNITSIKSGNLLNLILGV